MDVQNGINDPVCVYNLSVIEMIIGCRFYVNVGAFHCIRVGYRNTDAQNTLRTTHEVHHPRQFTTVEYYCLQTLDPHTEGTPAAEHTVYSIKFIDHATKTQVIKVRLIITYLKFIIFTYWNLFHNKLKTII